MTSNPIESFRAAMSQHGLVYDGQILADGKFTKFNCKGERGESSWFKLFKNNGEFYNGVFGDYRRDLSEKWNSYNGQPLTNDQRREIQQQQQEAMREKRTEEERLLADAKSRAQRILSSALQSIPAHEYLRRKQIKAHGELRFVEKFAEVPLYENCLALPLRDFNGALQTMQLIAPDKRFGKEGEKRDKTYLYGGKIPGAFYQVGDLTTGPLIVCEGYATGSSIHEATGWTVLCAMQLNNVEGIAVTARKRFPGRLLIVAADNDRFTVLHDVPTNVGLIGATAAAKSASALLAVPEFSDSDDSSTDFNDLAIVSGISVVRKTLEAVLPMPSIVDATDFIADTIVQPDELIEGILHRGCKLVLGGGSKTFKTWTLFDLAVSVCTQSPWLGFNTTRGRVLYINFEIQPAFFQHRLKAIIGANQTQLQKGSLDIWNLRGYAADYQQLIPKILESAGSRNYSLIVIDPIYKLYGELNENAAGEVAKLLNALDHLAVQADAAVAFGAHYSKGNQAGKEAIDRISGSGVFARDPDSILNFTKHEKEGCFSVESTLRNHKPVDPFVVEWEYPLFKRADDLDPAALKQPKSGGRARKVSLFDILNVMKDTTPMKGIAFKLLSERCGISPGSLSETYMPQLRKNGWVKTSDDGKQFITLLGSKAIEQNEALL